MPFKIVFCRDPIEPRQPDASFDREVEAARHLGIPYLLVDHDELDRRHDPAAAVQKIPVMDRCAALYRGWMLRAEDYRALYYALVERNVHLVNTPEQYSACHHLPEVHPYAAPWMVKTTWIEKASPLDDSILAGMLAQFGSGSVVLKDWVKSQAVGYWDEACFIPDASDTVRARGVVNRFLELQGESLTGGLVFRAFVPLAKSTSNVEEWRAFVFDGRILGCWPRSECNSNAPPDEMLAAVARVLPSRFASADFARKEDGGWILLETGDGQVSELPACAAPDEIFRPLAANLSAYEPVPNSVPV